MYKIIIVDDEDFARDGMEKIFQKIPEVKVVLKCADGYEARQYLENHAADAIFSDIRMKKMNGLELTKWIAENRKDCKVVLVSAYSDFSYAQTAIAYGVFGYLLKPVRPDNVKAIIMRLREERESKERKDIWKRDIKHELIELEMYHTIMNHSDSVERKLNKRVFFAKYQVIFMINNEMHENDAELIRAGLTNIFRWYGAQCVPVLTKKETAEYTFLLLGDYKDAFPAAEEIVNQIRKLMDLNAAVSLLQFGNITDLQQLNEHIAQEDEEDALIKKVKLFIDANLKESLSRDDVANYVHLDPSYFSKYFKKKSGSKFSDYLISRRIELVLKLLNQGYKVYDAAQEAGFRNRNYFNAVFKQQVGMNPTQYKYHRCEKEGSNEESIGN